MKKRLLILIAIGVCALAPTISRAQVIDANQLPQTESAASVETISPGASEPLSPADLQTKLDEARQLLKSKADVSNGKTVALAVLDPKTSDLHVLTIQKDSFLTKDAVISATAGDNSFRVTIIRANGVNTAVRVTDDSSGDELQPLM